LVDAVIGANAPELQRKIMSNLEQEKRILKEGGTRMEVGIERFSWIDGIRTLIVLHLNSIASNVTKKKRKKAVTPEQPNVAEANRLSTLLVKKTTDGILSLSN
jgi:hypothetical protein